MTMADVGLAVLIELSKKVVKLVGYRLAQGVVIGSPEHAPDIASAEPDRPARPIAAVAAASASASASAASLGGPWRLALSAVTRVSLTQPARPPTSGEISRVIKGPVSRGNGFNEPAP